MALDEVKVLRELADGSFTEDLTGAKLPATVAVPFDNTGTSFAAATVQAALVEAEARVVAAEGAITTAQGDIADILSGASPVNNATNLDGNNSAHYLNRANHTGSQAATTISYDNTISGLVATDVKAAIDELAAMPGGGATVFTDLTDVPSAYTGQSLKGVRVNAGETALEFYTIGGGGGTERMFIFDPVAVPSGNVYNNFATLVAAAQLVNGKKIILCNLAADAAIASAAYNLSNCTLLYMSDLMGIAGYKLNFANGATFTGLPDAIGVFFQFNNTVIPGHTTSVVNSTIKFLNYGKLLKTASAAFACVSSTHTLEIIIEGVKATVENTPGVTGVFGGLAADASIKIYVQSLETTIQATANVIGGNGTHNIYQLNGKQRTGSNSAITGTLTVTVSEFQSTVAKLTDGPGALAGQSLKALRVNVGETALEYYTPSGSSVNYGNTVIYDPDIAATDGNRYKTWAEVMAALAVSPLVTQLLIHKPGVFQTVSIAAGTFDLSKVIISVTPGTIIPILDLADGTTLSGFPQRIEGVQIKNNNTTAPLFTVAGFVISQLFDAMIVNSATATQPAWLVPNAASATLVLQGLVAPLFKESGGSEPVEVQGSLAIDVTRGQSGGFFNTDSVFTNQISGNGTITINSYVLLTGGYVGTHANYDGVLTINQREETRVQEMIDVSQESGQGTLAIGDFAFTATVNPGILNVGNYFWQKTGKLVFLNIFFEFGTAGSGVEEIILLTLVATYGLPPLKTGLPSVEIAGSFKHDSPNFVHNVSISAGGNILFITDSSQSPGNGYTATIVYPID